MKVVLLVNRDLPSALAVHQLMNRHPEYTYRLFVSEQVGGSKPKAAALSTLTDAEQQMTAEVARDSAKSLHSEHFPFGFDTLAEMGVWIRPGNTIHQAEMMSALEAFQADVFVSIRFGHILKPSVIGLPSKGVINLHSGILPDYRGIMATFWAMLADEKQIGTTLHYIDDEGIDTGRIISIQRQPLNRQHSYLVNTLSLYPPGVAAISHHLSALEKGQSPTLMSQRLDDGNYFGLPQDDDVDAFFNKGYTLIP